MILNTVELSTTLSYTELAAEVSAGNFDEVLATRSILVITSDAGVVQVNKDKTLTKNALIDLVGLKEEIDLMITESIHEHEVSHHSSVE